VAQKLATRLRRKLEDLEADIEVAREVLPMIDELLENRDLMMLQAFQGQRTEADKAEQRGIGKVMSEGRLLRQKCEETIALWKQLGGSDDPDELPPLLLPLPLRLPTEIERKQTDRCETLLRGLHHCSRRSLEQFRPLGKLLAEEEVRCWVTRETVEALLPIVRELCELLGCPARADTWKAEFESWLLSELQRFAGETVKQEAEAAAQEIARQKAAAEAAAQQQVPEKPATEASPPAEQTDQGQPAPIDLAGEPASRGSAHAGHVIADAVTPGNPADGISASDPVTAKASTLFRDRRKEFAAEVIAHYPDKSTKEVCEEMDRRRKSKQTKIDRQELAPPADRLADTNEHPGRDEWVEDENLWGLLYACDKTRHNLEVWISGIRKAMGLANRRAS
jgi:hypothetical protein